jgi:hypothetical protein
MAHKPRRGRRVDAKGRSTGDERHLRLTPFMLTSPAWQSLRLGIKEVDDGIWIVSFMHYDLGFIDLEQKTLRPLDNPFAPGLLPMS